MTMKAARNTTPQVITENGLCSSSAKRSGLCKPASASIIRSTRPTMTTTGAITWPALRMLTASGWRHRKNADVTNAPPPKPAKNRYQAMGAPQIGSNDILHHLT